MNIYLASPLFTDNEKDEIKKIANLLRNNGHNVYVPMEHQIENAWDYDNQTWAKMVFNKDIEQIKKSDKVICLYYGLYSDSGTAWECGFAYALGIPVYLIDKTQNNNSSLMVVNGSCNYFDFNNQK